MGAAHWGLSDQAHQALMPCLRAPKHALILQRRLAAIRSLSRQVLPAVRRGTSNHLSVAAKSRAMSLPEYVSLQY